MKDFFKGFWYEEEGMEIIQVIMIIAIVIALALLFKDGIMDYAQKLMTKFFDTDIL